MPEEDAQLIYLANYHARVKRAGEEAFSMNTYALPEVPHTLAEEIIEASRTMYGTPRHEAEAEITRFHRIKW